MRKDITFHLKEDDKEYLRNTKESMVYCEMEETDKGIFIDTDQWLYYHTFNRLDDWEKNLLILYSRYRSYTKVAERLNVQKSTTAYVIKEITEKINYIIKYGENAYINKPNSGADMGYIQGTARNGEQNSGDSNKG